LGRERKSEGLWAKPGLRAIAREGKALGNGEARVVEFNSLDEDSYAQMYIAKFAVEPPSPALVIPYQDSSSGELVVYVLGEGAAPGGIKVIAPGGASGNATLLSGHASKCRASETWRGLRKLAPADGTR